MKQHIISKEDIIKMILALAYPMSIVIGVGAPLLFMSLMFILSLVK